MSNKLRNKILGSSIEPKKKVVEYEGSKFEFRQPNYKNMNLITVKADIGGEGTHIDFMIWSIIYTLFDPETGTRVFEETDFDALTENYTGDFIEVMADHAAKIMQTNSIKDKKK